MRAGRGASLPGRSGVARVATDRWLAPLTLLVPLAFATAPALSAQETIASDRPGIGSGAFVLDAGTFQLETGLAYASTSSVDAYSFGQALVRIGVPGVELEILANSFVVTRGDQPSSVLDDEGFQDLGFGIKAPLARGLGGRANLSVQGILTAPTGSDGFTSDEWVPALVLLADLGLSERLGVGVNVGYQAGPGVLSEVTSVIVTPSVSLGGGVGAYAGWAGAFTSGTDTHFAEAGFVYLANADIQLDLNAGWDVDRDDWFLGAGLALRRIP